MRRLVVCIYLVITMCYFSNWDVIFPSLLLKTKSGGTDGTGGGYGRDRGTDGTFEVIQCCIRQCLYHRYGLYSGLVSSQRDL